MKNNVSITTKISSSLGNYGRIYAERERLANVGEIGTSDENKAYNRAIVIKAGVVQDVTDDEQNGAGVSATTLKLKATYVAMGWDFTDTWEILETESYPYFKTQTAPPVITSQVVSGATTISGKCVDGGLITLEIDGERQQMVSTGNSFSFTVSPLQAGHEVRVSAKADGKEQSYYTTVTVEYLGKGTEADPYQVYTASDLTGVYRKGYFKLMNDIDLTSYINQFSPSEGWQSIGREGSETIYFDGDGHKITGLWCNSTRDNTGLFSCFANGTIKNLTVETASGKQVKGGNNTGILIGKMINGTIDNCKVSGTVADGTPVGGMAGLFDGGSISRCHASVTISTTGATSYVGGLVGEITGGTIDQCVTEGTLKAVGTESYVGGMIGKNSATVTNSYSTASVTSSYNAAGLIAYNYGMVEKCYATGDLASSNFAAGVIGYNDGSNAVVKNCVAMNNKIDVTYESQSAQSGGYGQRIIGGIKNSAPAPELNNYALKTMQVSVNDVPQKVYDDIMNGVAKTSQELLQQSTYSTLGWNFNEVWGIKSGEYPYLLAIGDLSIAEPDNPDDPIDPIIDARGSLSVPKFTVQQGEGGQLSINMDNEDEIIMTEFHMQLPEGLHITTDEDGYYDATLGDRADRTHTLEVGLGTNGLYHFLAYSSKNKPFTGTEGELLSVNITCDESVDAGTYQGKLRGILMSNTDKQSIEQSDITFNIEVTDYLLGDVNHDRRINGMDIVEMVELIMSSSFDRAGDLYPAGNPDGVINGMDLVEEVELVMSQTLGNNAPALAARTERLTMKSERSGVKSLGIQSDRPFILAQMTVELSDGMTLSSITSDRRHEVAYRQTGDNKYVVVCYSNRNETFEANGKALEFHCLGDGGIRVSDVLLIDADKQECLGTDAQSGDVTGIQEMEDERLKMNDSDIYDLSGRKIESSKLRSGVYVVNGKKVLEK